jgi:hypothetical protein
MDSRLRGNDGYYDGDREPVQTDRGAGAAAAGARICKNRRELEQIGAR